MPLKRPQLERQIKAAQEDLAAWEKALDAKGIAATARKKEPKWRHLDAKRRQLKSRLRAVAGIEAREADCAKRLEGGDDSKD